jgi:hypothetical protein
VVASNVPTLVPPTSTLMISDASIETVTTLASTVDIATAIDAPIFVYTEPSKPHASNELSWKHSGALKLVQKPT